MVESGVHPTIAGVALGLLATAHPPARADLERVNVSGGSFREQPTPAVRAIDRRRAAPGGLTERAAPAPHRPVDEPTSSCRVFALANAGIALDREVLERGRVVADHDRDHRRARRREARRDHGRDVAREPPLARSASP